MKRWDISAGAAIVAALLVGTANATETITYQYDAKGRLIKVIRTGTINNGVTSEYAHDKADNRSQVKVTGSPNPPPP
jgi:YD repeat-containing protein